MMGLGRLYRQVGLHDTQDEIYLLHSLRTFASDALPDCGLAEKYCMAIVGHKGLGSEGSYISWQNVENAWAEKCRDKMCFLDNGAVAQKQVVELTRQNGKLEALIERLLERLS